MISPATVADGQKTKVLMIDDTAVNREAVRRLLLVEGYDVVEADHGQLGYTNAISEQPDIILLDLNMPGLDGFEVLRKLKATLDTQEIPVIILSGTIEAAAEDRCMGAGAADYIHKPWDCGDLVDRIRIVLGTRPNKTGPAEGDGRVKRPSLRK